MVTCFAPNDDEDGYARQPWLRCCFTCAHTFKHGRLCKVRKSADGQWRQVWPVSLCKLYQNRDKEYAT